MVKRCLVAVSLLSLCNVTFALERLGPPRATVGKQHGSLGIEYTYSETDTELSNVVTSTDGAVPDTSSKALEANRTYAVLRYGPLDKLDIFARLGVSQFESQIRTSTGRFVGDTDLAWGVGTALTVYERASFSWGVVGQWSHGESNMDKIDPTHHIRSEMEMDSLQIATGPTYQVRDDLSLYGGGFYHALDGEYDHTTTDYDFEEDSCLGLFAGLEWEIKEDARWTIEIQHTGTAVALGTGLQWLLK